MAGSDPGPARGSTGSPDRQTLQLLESHLSDDALVTKTAFEPDSYEPRLLSAALDPDRYPPAVESVRVDVRWFESGDFSIHYVEHRADDSRWECRWDRHPNVHNARLHFHQPPDGTDVVDLSLASGHPLDVYATVFTAIETRIEAQWES